MAWRFVLVMALALPGPSFSSPLPMTDYSQLNHDEPTHWTKPATTPTEQEVSKLHGSTEQVAQSTVAVEVTSEGAYSTVSESGQDVNTGVMIRTTGPTEVNTSIDSLTTTDQTGTSENNSASSEQPTTLAQNFTKEENNDITSEIASIEARDNLINASYKENQAETSSKLPVENTTDQFYRYDIIEDIRNLFSNDNDISENEIKENQLEDVVGFKNDDKVPTEESLTVSKLEDGGYENYQEEEEARREEGRKLYDSVVVPTLGDREQVANYETPFSDWDRESEEQEHALENIVFQASNESEVAAMDLDKGSLQAGSWFLLLLAGNSTIVQMRQKDFAKYLKLNLAARLSLEYDELRVNKVVLAPPRLMVNVSVVPSENDNFDEEFDLNERLFGEEEAPLHKLAETNATLLELSGEEYHVVRFLSLRSAQPITMEEAVSEASTQTNYKHPDIEDLIYIIVGGPCIMLIIYLVYTLYRMYILPKKIEWPWKRQKTCGPRHHRMEEGPPIGGPLTVIYSGSFVERNGPPSGNWLEEHYHPRSEPPAIENPNYGLGSLSKTALSDICDPSVLDSPRINVRLMGCQPAHLLLPHTPVKKALKDLRPPRLVKGLDNPNYLT